MVDTAALREPSGSFTSIDHLFRPSNPLNLPTRILSRKRLESLKKEIETDSHLITLHELYARYDTHPVRGLTSARAAQMLEYCGPNTLTPPSGDNVLHLLFRSMCTGFSVLIWLGAGLCFTAYVMELMATGRHNRDNVFLAVVLASVDVICGLFSFFQAYQSTKIMTTFNSMLPSYAHCVRDGVAEPRRLTRDLVRGDLVRMKAGDVVPADIRIIDSQGFKVDNSSLTGESTAIHRYNTDGTANILESHNVAFFSTLCVEGQATGIVLCTGDLTALGRVAGLAARLRPAPSPLAHDLRFFMRAISVWAVVLGVVVASAALYHGYPYIKTIVFVIGIIVANVPEGLQPTVTASLTLAAKRMFRRNCLVKNLEAVEALGGTTVVCSDKTGTLTENRMCVQHLWLYNVTYLASDTHSDALASLRRCGALCSTATLSESGAASGDASECAILDYLCAGAADAPLVVRAAYPKVAELPFNSTDKYQVSIHLDQTKSCYVAMLKGAPEAIIARCSSMATKRDSIAMSANIAQCAIDATDALASTGERVLAFADHELSARSFPLGFQFSVDNVNFPIQGYRMLGLMGLMDPPKKNVLSAVQRMRTAGVRVLMVTGDHPLTARAIAEKVGIATGPHCAVLTGTQLRDMPPNALNRVLAEHHEIVFARTSPTQKLQIVEACQRRGDVVAVTGDGVNDAPALRQADIGISMGITGSQVSKQTADLVLLDDNFSTIVIGIEEGRKIFDNLKKSITYILASNVPEIVPVLMFVIFSIPLPLGVLTILCVDLGTDMWPAVGLAHERAEADVMVREPRSHDDMLVTPRLLYLAYGQLGLIEACAGMFAYFFVMAEHGFYPSDLFGIRERWDRESVPVVLDSIGQSWSYDERKELERTCHTAYFVAVVVTQITNGLICKTRYNSFFQQGMRNWVLNTGLVLEIAVACCVCYLPPARALLHTYPLRFRWWLLALPFSLFMIVYDEMRKYCIRKKFFNDFFRDCTYS